MSSPSSEERDIGDRIAAAEREQDAIARRTAALDELIHLSRDRADAQGPTTVLVAGRM